MPKRLRLFEDSARDDDYIYELADLLSKYSPPRFKRMLSRPDLEDFQGLAKVIQSLVSYYDGVTEDFMDLYKKFEEIYKDFEKGRALDQVDYLVNEVLSENRERAAIEYLKKVSDICARVAARYEARCEVVNSMFRRLVSKMEHCKGASEAADFGRWIYLKPETIDRMKSWDTGEGTLVVFENGVHCLRVAASFDKFMDSLSEVTHFDAYERKTLISEADVLPSYVNSMSELATKIIDNLLSDEYSDFRRAKREISVNWNTVKKFIDLEFDGKLHPIYLELSWLKGALSTRGKGYLESRRIKRRYL